MLPRVQPIAPVRRTEPFDDPEWFFDLKYDGFRALCYFEQGRCRMISRNDERKSAIVTARRPGKRYAEVTEVSEEERRRVGDLADAIMQEFKRQIAKKLREGR